MNQLKTLLLLSVLTVLFVLFGKMVGGQHGMLIALLLAGMMNFVAYFFSDRIVLAMHGARELAEWEAPELHEIVERLARRAGIPKPRVYLIPTETPNAFATGRDPHHAAVAVTEGIVRLLNRDELEGVIAHELAHIKHRDTLVMVVAATLAGAIAVLADFARFFLWFGAWGGDDRERGNNPLVLVGLLVGVIVLPLAAMLIQLAISRAREFLADEGGAYISGKPLALASALAKLERGVQLVPMETSPATAHLFIVSPLAGGQSAWGALANLFRTHPPTEERIARLQALAEQMTVRA
ncbi:Protease HtpX [bacterium HR17]|uniref:Protease HtpX homolog n=1 Tax=Candidatus Fervidibacter japonicus TaxID=2035412 RepID=A0A2H5X9H7_9BACT|nr:Protease HtpX [bacterium HR17]